MPKEEKNSHQNIFYSNIVSFNQQMNGYIAFYNALDRIRIPPKPVTGKMNNNY